VKKVYKIKEKYRKKENKIKNNKKAQIISIKIKMIKIQEKTKDKWEENNDLSKNKTDKEEESKERNSQKEDKVILESKVT